jgi:cobalt/nickel transport system permease protein
MVQVLDDYAITSPLRKKNNFLKISIVTFGIFIGLLSSSPITPLFVFFVMSFSTVYFGKIPFNSYLKILTIPAGFVLTSAVVIAFISGGGSNIFSFTVFGHTMGISKEGLNMAILVLSRSMGGTSCLFFLSLTTPMIELFSVLKAAKLPDSFVEISMMMYRYIFVFIDVAMGVKYAQTVRLGYHDFKTSFRSMAMLGTNLFIRSWEQGEKLYLSMNSRCYDGKLIMYDEKRPVNTLEILLTAMYFTVVLTVFSLTRGISFI